MVDSPEPAFGADKGRDAFAEAQIQDSGDLDFGM